MFKHLQCEVGSHRLDYGYVLEISDQATLFAYFDAIHKNHILKGYRDAAGSDKYLRLCGEDGGHHFKTEIGYALVASMAAAKHPGSLVEKTLSLQDKTFSAMSSILSRNGKIYINSRGGFFSPSENEYVIATKEMQEPLFPSLLHDVRITKWPDGQHYYARIGNLDIVDPDGNMKWDTKEEAELRVKEYIAAHNLA